MNFQTVSRLMGYLAVVTIIVLSLLPGDERPHTGASGHIEHTAAYFITMVLLSAGHPRQRQRIIALCLLSACSGLMEIAQIYIPGRSASIGDAVVSTVGAALGLGAYMLVSSGRLSERYAFLTLLSPTRKKS